MDLQVICCPIDKGQLVKDGELYKCLSCDAAFSSHNGIPDLVHSTLPDVDGHVPYIWSDVFYLENVLKQLVKPNQVIVEVCSGPNIIVPLLLKRLNIPVTYTSIGINEAHLLQQQQGVPGFPIISVKGDATALPLANQSVDLYIGHHAINDIWLTKGEVGVTQSYHEMHRVLKQDGFIIQSDCVLQHDSRVGDPSTKLINLTSMTNYLDELQYQWVREDGGEMDWVIASRQPFSLQESEDFNLKVNL